MKAEFKAFVELIYHQCGYKAGIEVLLPQMVVHTSGSADDNGRVNAPHRTVLVHCRTSAVAAHRLERDVHRLEYVFYLQGKLARRYEHHRLYALHIGFERLHQRQQECQCLARPRGRQQDEVLIRLIGIPRCFLHRGELLYP